MAVGGFTFEGDLCASILIIKAMKDYRRMTRAELIKRLSALESQDAWIIEMRQAKLAKAALHDSRERMRAILQTAVEGIITINERGIVETMNPAAEKIFLYKAAEVMGQNVSMLMPAPYHQEHDGYLANYRRTRKAKIIGIGREVVGRRKNGTTFPMDLSVGEMRVAGGRMFTGIIRDITERKRLEKEILEISDREQRRIGQDLHDDLGQRLTGIELISEVLEQKLARKSKLEAARAAEIASHVREAISQTRLLARGLSPVMLESDGLMSALEELGSNTGKLFHISCRFQCDIPVLVTDPTIATHLYRIAQEAVSNAVKHGRAKKVLIQLQTVEGRTVLTINDNGIGFPKLMPKRKGMGLRIMQYRASIIGGAVEVQPSQQGGSVVICSVRNNNHKKTRKI
jgi:two-component system sensor kinase FixL